MQKHTSVVVDVVKTPMLPVCRVGTFKGFLLTFAYAALALLVPLLWYYIDFDTTDNVTRGVTIGLSAVATGLVVYADDCIVWYNMALFFHTGLEVYLIDVAFDYAHEAGRTDAEMGLALAGAITLIVHLVPFYLLDSKWLLTLLASAGVVVNTAVFVFLDTTRKASADLVDTTLLLYVGSSVALLISTLLVVGHNCMKPSMLTLLRYALMEGSCITCAPYEP